MRIGIIFCTITGGIWAFSKKYKAHQTVEKQHMAQQLCHDKKD